MIWNFINDSEQNWEGRGVLYAAPGKVLKE